jgi:hypothetical protein
MGQRYALLQALRRPGQSWPQGKLAVVMYLHFAAEGING